MSGHSKWATTKNKKEAADKKRSSIFTKLARNISVAARKGGDPDMNFSLRLAIDRAKDANVPKDNIERAIKKGTGEDGGAVLEEVLYEAYGPHGVPIIIEAVTDNKNRSTSDIKAILNKYGGTLASQNAVQWMFEKKGLLRISLDKVPDIDSFTLELIDLGADDVREEDAGLTVFVGFTNFEKLKKALEAKNIVTDYAEVEWVPKEKNNSLDVEAQGKIENLVEILEDYDDVNNVYTNV